MLTKKGVHPKIVQNLARHSSIKLTMDRYSRIELLDERSALKVLPSILPDGRDDKEANRAVVQKTGTDDFPVMTVRKTVEKTATKTATKTARKLPQTAYLTGQSMSEKVSEKRDTYEVNTSFDKSDKSF